MYLKTVSEQVLSIMIFCSIFIYFSLLKMENSFYFTIKQIHNVFINMSHTI